MPFLIPGTSVHRSIVARLVVLPIAAVVALFLYQGTNPAIYYVIAWAIYFWGYSEGEVCKSYISQGCFLITVLTCIRPIRLYACHGKFQQEAEKGAEHSFEYIYLKNM